MSDIKLFKINDFRPEGKESSFYVNRISQHLMVNHSRIEKPHRHNFYAVFLFTKGTGVHEIDFQKYEVKPGSVFFLYPGQTHSWELSEDAEGFLFFHNAEYYEMNYISNTLRDFLFFESNYSDKCLYLTEDQCQFIEEKFQNIFKESIKEEWKKSQLILSYLTQIYIYLNRYLEKQQSKNIQRILHYQTIFSNFEKLLDLHFIEIKSATQYAQLLHISQKHLNRIVQYITGKTTTEVITDRVLLEAKRLLLYTDLTMNQISLNVGYSDAAYFSRLFKKHAKINPTDFRKQYKNEHSHQISSSSL